MTTFLGGACAIRKSAFLQVGGLPEKFFYAHEETDLAWRLLGEGYRIEYDAEPVMYHPLVLPSRHTDFYRLNARNRVWLARRNLPWPLAMFYLLNWVVLTLLRERSMPAIKAWFRGFFEGLREAGGRAPSHGLAHRLAHAAARPPAHRLDPDERPGPQRPGARPLARGLSRPASCAQPSADMNEATRRDRSPGSGRPPWTMKDVVEDRARPCPSNHETSSS